MSRTVKGSSIVDLVKMTCKDIEEMDSTSILIEKLAMLSNFTGNVLALLLFTVYDLRKLLGVSGSTQGTEHVFSIAVSLLLSSCKSRHCVVVLELVASVP